ncbi:MAG: P-loop NTPase [Clostridia bacterium]|jgi:CO dehydrogenase maturation factor|nr:P-loop NTPase [Clostridia bacterium]
MKIAISGKGGVGKTTIAAGLIRYFANKGFEVIAVDADPDLSLGTLLGLPDNEIEEIKPIVDMRELILEKTGEGAYFTLNPQVDDLLEDFSIPIDDNIKFLKMGAVKQGGSSCYCRENTVLHALVASLILQKDQMVLLDMGAGIEHLTRGTARGVDVMLIVTEPSRTSIQTAKTVRSLAAELGIKQIKFIGNKIHETQEEDFLIKHLGRENFLSFLHYQGNVSALSMEPDNSGLNDLAEFVEQLGQRLEKEVGIQSIE